uniref:Non-structural polyprotein 1AB n=1 Tax=Yancheng grey stingfish astrovirus TaxID=2116114 RepID=A0A2P1GMG3_9VIRU|nr:ORF1ab [Yancheng grey stingfish astrovirus]
MNSKEYQNCLKNLRADWGKIEQTSKTFSWGTGRPIKRNQETQTEPQVCDHCHRNPTGDKRTLRMCAIIAKVFLAILLFEAARRLGVGAVIVDGTTGECGAIDITHSTKEKACEIIKCQQINCSYECQEGFPCVTQMRSEHLKPEAWTCLPKENETVVLQMKQLDDIQKAVWHAIVLGLGGIHKCPGKTTPDETFMGYMYRQWISFDTSDIVSTQKATNVWDAVQYLWTKGLVTIIIILYALANILLHQQWDRLIDIGFALIPAVFCKNAGLAVTLLPWLEMEFKILLSCSAVVVTHVSGAGPFVLVVISLITALTMAQRLVTPKTFKTDDVVVFEGVVDMLSSVTTQALSVTLVVIFMAVAHDHLLLSIFVVLCAAVVSVVILPPPPPEQIAIVKDSNNKPHRVRVYPKRRTRLGPVYTAQAKRAANNITNLMINNSYEVQNGNMLSTGFCANGRFWVIKHAICDMNDVQAKVNGQWQRLNPKDTAERKLDAYQTIIGFQVPQGCKSAKTETTPVDGWFTIVNNQDGKNSAQVFYGVVIDGEIKGCYTNAPGMSGSPLYDATGKVVAVHAGGVGDTGIAISIPTLDTTPSIPVVTHPHPTTPSDTPIINQSRPVSKITDTRRRLAEADRCLEEAVSHMYYLSQKKQWTDEEYHKLQDMGISTKQLRDMARDIINEKRHARDQTSDESDSDDGSDDSYDWHKERASDYDWEQGYSIQRKQKPKSKPKCKPKARDPIDEMNQRIEKLEFVINQYFNQSRNNDVKPTTSGEGNDEQLDAPSNDDEIVYRPAKKPVRKGGKNRKPTAAEYQAQCYREQRTKRQPVKAKCGEVTTSYQGHLKACGDKCGCTPDDKPEELPPCVYHCVHYWCEEQRQAKGINECPGKDCKSDYCKLKKAGNRQRHVRCCGQLTCPFEAISYVEPIKHRKEVHGCRYVGKIKLPTNPIKLEKHDRGLERVLKLTKTTGFEPAYWKLENYETALSKHSYAQGRTLTEDEIRDARWVLADEYNYMRDTRPIPIYSTEKNSDSHPGIPARFLYLTEQEMIDDIGMATYRHVEECFERGRPPYLWYGFLKSELVKTSKNQSSDTRMIQCPPCQINRMAARFEHQQNALMKELTLQKEAQVGWSPLKGGLDNSLMRFRECSTYLELDWTRYDGTLPNQIMDLVSEHRASNLCCTKSEFKSYSNYRRTLTFRPTAVATGDVILIPKGNPSGQFSTSADNCMVQTILVFLETKAWVKECGMNLTNEEIRQLYVNMSYGDDRITGYKLNQGIPLPPPKNWLTTYYKTTHGMWVKDENVKVHNQLQGATFCGMTFTQEYGVYIPCYKPEKLYTSLKDPAKPSNDMTILQEKLNNISCLLALGKGELEGEVRRAKQVLKNIDPSYSPLTESEELLLLGGPKYYARRQQAERHKPISRWLAN